MKFVLFFDTLDQEGAVEKVKEIKNMAEEAEKLGLKLTKALSPPYIYAGGKGGFQILEAENVEQLMALSHYYADTSDFTFVPILDMEEVLRLHELTEKAFKSSD